MPLKNLSTTNVVITMAMQFYGASVLGSYVSNQVFVSRRLNTRSWDSICYLIPVID